MAFKITLRNDFHNKTVNVMIPSRDGEYTLSRSQMRRVTKALCGRHDCKCGVVRGTQDFPWEHSLARVTGFYGSSEYETITVNIKDW